ncbi:MAG: mechanosensitive ion channel domain-containing protein [Planctomycetota bacterium]
MQPTGTQIESGGPAESAGVPGAATGEAASALGGFGEVALNFLPWLIGLALLVGALLAANYVLLVRPTLAARAKTQRRGLMLALTVLAVVVAILTMPIEQSATVAVLQLLGLAVTALITLSSTTIAANFMAGLMLGRVGSFRSGDFIDVAGQVGRVTDRGLFHVEIQTEDRDLITLPNSYMITNPVRVVRQSGTIVSCELSLGYDEPHGKLEPLMLQAAESAGLEDPYVQVRALGDFSVTYRVCGFLKDTKTLISTRTALRKALLDTLHGARVEIVSPTFMNQRRVEEPVIGVPLRPNGDLGHANGGESPESIMFDKADDAERLERLRDELASAKAALKKLESDDESVAAMDKAERKNEVRHQKTYIEYLTSRVARMEARDPEAEP